MLARILCWLALAATAMAQTAGDSVLSQVRQYRNTHAAEILRSYAELLAIPDLATDTANIRRNAEAIQAQLQARGVATRLLEAPDSPPIVLGDLKGAAGAGARTLIIYAHYDGQPVDAAQWKSPPWQPVFRDEQGRDIPLEQAVRDPESRVYARAASDDKAPIGAILAALDALRAAGVAPRIHFKFFFEGEEEAGSPHLRAAIESYRDLLKADAWLICDGPVHQTRHMQVYFGARGVTGLEMTVYGPQRPLHSGHYGNWAPNPAAMLANLLSAMRDDDARIRIPHFYDEVRPLTSAEREALQRMPDIDGQLKTELQIARTEAPCSPPAPSPACPQEGATRIEQNIMQPALNIRGFEAGHTGAKAQNAVMTEAHASIDFRLVPDQSPQRVQQRVEDFIRGRGYTVVHDAPDAAVRMAHPRLIRLEWEPGYPAARSDMASPVARDVIAAIERATGSVYEMPTLGGSVPMYLFTDVLKTPAIGVPIVNHDNNQHAANENLRLRNFWEGIDIFAAILTQ
ncbi:MAG: M20/M25/M40 family metallo-hydrolase [Acidobacteria bacterium]|nr:M20/M25/M40 family metallo-hydrolase [Acidobacteriota bacterium]